MKELRDRKQSEQLTRRILPVPAVVKLNDEELQEVCGSLTDEFFKTDHEFKKVADFTVILFGQDSPELIHCRNHEFIFKHPWGR